MTTSDLTRDHAQIHDSLVVRRYFGKFRRITGHLPRVAAVMEQSGRLSKLDTTVIGSYIRALSATLTALGNRYMMTGRLEGLGHRLTFDRVESGFPIHAELMAMAADAPQAERHLRNMDGTDEIKDQMIRQILSDRTIPTRLQYALSQRLYYEELFQGDLFWPRNDPVALWQGDLPGSRRRYLLHWAVYDSLTNLPAIYLMDVDDSGRTALARDTRRWPEAQAHLMAQSVNGLKLVTIAQGFDADFDDLHPTRLRRLHVGPMYSHAFTLQEGPIRAVLETARAPQGEDWALAFTIEELESSRIQHERAGWFGTVERQVFALDPLGTAGVDTGATRVSRALVMPERPYQALAELNPPGLSNVAKFVVNAAGRVLTPP